MKVRTVRVRRTYCACGEGYPCPWHNTEQIQLSGAEMAESERRMERARGITVGDDERDIEAHERTTRYPW